MHQLNFDIRGVLLEREGRWWVCLLEVGLFSDGATREEAVRLVFEGLEVQIQATLEIGNPRNLFQPADPEYWEKYATGVKAEVAYPFFTNGPNDPVHIHAVSLREWGTTMEPQPKGK